MCETGVITVSANALNFYAGTGVSLRCGWAVQVERERKAVEKEKQQQVSHNEEVWHLPFFHAAS